MAYSLISGSTRSFTMREPAPEELWNVTDAMGWKWGRERASSGFECMDVSILFAIFSFDTSSSESVFSASNEILF